MDSLKKENLSEFTPEEVELLEALRRTEREMTVPPGVDVKALAISAVDAYWAEREKAEQGKEFGLIRETAELARATARRIIDPVWEFTSEVASVLIPTGITLGATYLFFFSSRGFNETKSISWANAGTSIYWVSAVPLVLAGYLAFRYFTAKRKDRGSFMRILRHSMGSLVSGLVVAALIWWLGGYGYRQRSEISNNLEVATQKLEDTSLVLAQDQLEEISLKSMEEKQNTGEFLIANSENVSVPAARKVLNITTSNVGGQKAEYTAGLNGLNQLGEMYALVGADAGVLYFQNGEERQLRTQFIVGKIEQVSDGSFKLKLRNPEALKMWAGEFKNIKLKENLLSIRTTYTGSEIAEGRKVAVALDPSAQEITATRVSVLHEKSGGSFFLPNNKF